MPSLSNCHASRRAKFLTSRVLDEGPALVLRNRRALLDPHRVADLGGIRLVMRMVLLGSPHGLFEDRMGKGAVDAHHHGLVVHVGDHGPLQNALGHRFLLTWPRTSGRGSF